MKLTVEAMFWSFVMVIGAIAFYVNFVKPHVGTEMQTIIGI
jgi:hypothetical protein